MEPDNLMNFFKNVYVKNIRYCAVCLRSEQDVRISSPPVFRKILRSLKFLECFKNENICNLCEARASAMSNFMDMIQWSLELQLGLQRAAQSTEMNKLVGTEVISDTFEKLFKKIRALKALRSTPVQHVDGVTRRSRQIGMRGTRQHLGENNSNVENADIEMIVIDDDNSQDTINSNPQMNNQISMPPETILVVSDSDDSNSSSRTLEPTTSKNTVSSCNLEESGKTCTLPGASLEAIKVRELEIIDDDLQIILDEDSSNSEIKLTEDPSVDERQQEEATKEPLELTTSGEDFFMDRTMRVLPQALLTDLHGIIKIGTKGKPVK